MDVESPAIWPDGSRLAGPACCSVKSQTVGVGNDDPEFGHGLVAVASGRALDTRRELHAGRDMAMVLAQSLTRRRSYLVRINFPNLVVCSR